MEKVFTLLTSEDKKDIRAAVKSMVIQQIKNDFDGHDRYLLSPYDIENMVGEVVEEIKEEVKEMYRDMMIKQMEEKLSQLMK